MRKRTGILLLSVICVAAVGVSIWQASRANTLKQQLHAMHQQSFYHVVEGMGDVELQLSKLMISAGPQQGVMLLTQIASQAEQVQVNLAQIPLRHAAMGDSIKFANQLSDYSQQLANGMVAGRPLSEKDLGQLESLLTQCTLLNQQLSVLSQNNDPNALLWLTDARAFWSDTPVDPAPLEGIVGTGSGIEYPTLIYDGPFSDGKHRGQARGLPAGDVTDEMALTIAKDFYGAARVRNATRSADGEGPIPTWGVSLDTEDGNITVQVTRQGGKVLWMVPEQAQFTKTLTVSECAMKAYTFLQERGYGHMEPHYWQEYDGLAVVNFAAVQDGVLLYPDLVKVQVRMDTGAVIGLEANNFLMNHVARDLPKAMLTAQDAEALVSDRLTIERSRLCLIPQEAGERLCYEVVGSWGGSQYIVYIDASDGKEADILKIIDNENGRLSA